MDLVTLGRSFGAVFRKYRAAALVILTGIFLMALPAGRKQPPPAAAPEPSAPCLEQRLSELLSRMEGAGKVRVLLTEDRGERTLYQYDEEKTDTQLRRTTVLASGADRQEHPLVRQVEPPTYLGAVILSQGAGSARVKLALVEAVEDATGLTSDRITVLTMK